MLLPEFNSIHLYSAVMYHVKLAYFECQSATLDEAHASGLHLNLQPSDLTQDLMICVDLYVGNLESELVSE